jgi:hypothetical protein
LSEQAATTKYIVAGSIGGIIVLGGMIMAIVFYFKKDEWAPQGRRMISVNVNADWNRRV